MILQQLFASYDIQVCLCTSKSSGWLDINLNELWSELDRNICNQWKLKPHSGSLSQVLISALVMIIGEVISSDVETYGASAHSDYGMVTLLLTDGVPGLQVCRDKSKQPHIWEDVPGIKGAFIVNIGDMMERWTNGLFR